MSLRLFAALDLPDETADRLLALQKGVRGAKWRPREALHLTLRFFGEIDEPTAEELDHELGEIRKQSFEVTLKSAGWFGRKDPGVLWIGAAENEALKALAAAVERAARRVGLGKPDHGFTPHVTLAYCKATPVEDAMKFAQRLALFEAEPFLADRFFLVSSWPGKRVSDYVHEAEYPLVG
jgi:2'-5' RNA ligase